LGLKKKSARGTPPDGRAAAVEMVEKGGKLREMAQAFKVSHQTMGERRPRRAPSGAVGQADARQGDNETGLRRRPKTRAAGVVEVIAAQRACHGAGASVSGRVGEFLVNRVSIASAEFS